MRFTLLAAAMLALGCAPAFAQAGAKASIEKTLIANENRINEAVAKHDSKAFLDLIAPDAVAADMAGFSKAADFTKTMDQLKISTWHLMDTKVMWIDDKAAVVTYKWMGKGTYMNEPLPETTYSSTVWVERNGKWLALFHQETAAAPPAPPAKK
jgi:hypothetical protein